MFAFLSLGFLFGLAHAFEADHVAAVSALVSGKTSRRAMVRYGVFWGVGHTISLLIVGIFVLASGMVISAGVATSLELLVGIMLVGLGASVLYRLHRDRVHFHHHAHANGPDHIHLHSHLGEAQAHQRSSHGHNHSDPAVGRSLLVGIMHGMAGSAALVLIVATSTGSTIAAIGYIVLFGAGSVLGMGMMSAALAVPLSFTARAMTRANSALQILIGAGTILVGGFTVYATSLALLG